MWLLLIVYGALLATPQISLAKHALFDDAMTVDVSVSELGRSNGRINQTYTLILWRWRSVAPFPIDKISVEHRRVTGQNSFGDWVADAESLSGERTGYDGIELLGDTYDFRVNGTSMEDENKWMPLVRIILHPVVNAHECQQNITCPNNAYCTLRQGWYACACNDGYCGDGTSCSPCSASSMSANGSGESPGEKKKTTWVPYVALLVVVLVVLILFALRTWQSKKKKLQRYNAKDQHLILTGTGEESRNDVPPRNAEVIDNSHSIFALGTSSN